MKSVVIDPSMAISWVLPDERSDLGDSILYETGEMRRITTGLFWYEYRSILVSNERRKRLNRSEVPACLAEIQLLKIEEYNLTDHQWVISLAFKHNLSAYDASYLALALEEGAILATNDRRLAQAALAEEVELRTTLEGVR